MLHDATAREIGVRLYGLRRPCGCGQERGPVVTYGANDMVLGNWGVVAR
jgi:hypothetical protein